MAKGPDPRQAASIGYTLAQVSAVTLLLALLLGLFFGRSSSPVLSNLTQIVWLVLPASAAGTFLAVVSRQELKKKNDEANLKKANAALRINLLSLVAVILLLVIFVVFTIVVR